MGDKVLIAFDYSENAIRAVTFAANALHREHRITLFNVIPDTATLCEMQSPELHPVFLAQRAAFCSIEDKERDLVHEAAGKAKDVLLGSGFAEEQVSVKVVTKSKGIARDIIAEARLGYDLVVLGRRGMTGIKEFFIGSISHKVLGALRETSVLIVG
jgi:nucleotide-binding universal stress UspA family protein